MLSSFSKFSQSLQINPEKKNLKMGHDHFLSHPFEVIIQSSCPTINTMTYTVEKRLLNQVKCKSWTRGEESPSQESFPSIIIHNIHYTVLCNRNSYIGHYRNRSMLLEIARLIFICFQTSSHLLFYSFPTKSSSQTVLLVCVLPLTLLSSSPRF
jgi:hypothetical protein